MAEKRSAFRKFFIFLLLIALVLGLLVASLMVDRVVWFADPNLEWEIRKLLEEDTKPIKQSQLLSFIELDLSGKKINDISGLEHFRNLEVLNLENNFIKDLSPLITLYNLTSLNISNNGITNLEEVRLDSLTHLSLVELQLNSYEILSSVGRRNRISDINLLGRFNTLQVLEIQGNQIGDISALSGLRKLVDLDLRENQIQDITPLDNLRSLEQVDLSQNHIYALSALSNLRNLTKLNLRGNEISDISPLQNLDNLEYLNLHSNAEIQSVEPIAGLLNLSELILENVPVGDQVWIFENLTQLTRLNITHCQISDYSALADLMEVGTLHDDPVMGVEATLSIRDNLLSSDQVDPLQDLRPYWENITHRDPFILPTIAGMVEVPHFSQPGGYFTDAFDLTLTIDDPNLEIYYTLDGSDPNPKHVGDPPSPYQVTYLYSDPIKVANRSNDDNVYSEIRTTHVENILPWAPPKGNVFKGQTVRAIAYDSQRDSSSPIVTHSYFVDRDITQRYPSLPVISLTADYEVLFEPKTGILNTGLGDNPFYHLETRVPANLELFQPNGDIGFNGLYEIKLHGFTSVANPQKGFHVYAEPWLGAETIDYPLFQNATSKANQLENVERFILRAWGTALEWDVFFSDAYHQTLMAQSELDIQGYQPAILFINGEYWVLYEIREANKNLEYFEAHYFPEDSPELDILELGTADFIQAGDSDHWKNLLAFIDTHDIRLDENYAYIQTQMDVDNFIQYIIHCIFTGKKDWPGHNEAMWRPRTPDGQWRWIQFDMDQGLRYGVDNFEDMVGHVLEDGEIPHPLLNKLLENEEFKLAFLNTFAHLMNTTFRTSVEVAHFNQMADELAPYIPETIDRWQYDMDWDETKDLALRVIQDRWVLRKNQVLDNFDLSGTSQVQILTNPEMGSIAINGFVIEGETPGVEDPGSWDGAYFEGLPVRFSAIPKPGYQFVRWECNLEIDLGSESFSTILSDDVTLKVVFAPID